MNVEITGLKASPNNEAATVLELFLDAVSKYGAPSRARGDRGGENIEVSVWMILHRGAHRASFMWGSYVCPPENHVASVCSHDSLALHEIPGSSAYGLKLVLNLLGDGGDFSCVLNGATVLIAENLSIFGCSTIYIWI
jgi:hypothetical protein